MFLLPRRSHLIFLITGLASSHAFSQSFLQRQLRAPSCRANDAAAKQLAATVTGDQDISLSLRQFRRMFGHETTGRWPSFCFVDPTHGLARRIESVRDVDEEGDILRLFTEGPVRMND